MLYKVGKVNPLHKNDISQFNQIYENGIHENLKKNIAQSDDCICE